MKCCIKNCKKEGSNKYKIREVKFCYCKKHSIVPEKIIKNIKQGYYISPGIGSLGSD